MRHYSSRRQAVGTLFGFLAFGGRGRSLYAQPGVQLDLDSTGLSSIQFNGVEYLAYGDFRLDQVTFRASSGKAALGDLTAQTVVDFALKRITRVSSWGSIIVDYSSAGNRMNARVTVNNRSADVLESIWFEPFGLRFPTRIQEYDDSTPLITNTINQPALVRATCGSGVMVIASDDGAKPVQIGLPWAADRPKSTVFPLTLNTGKVSSYPDSYPAIDRPILPGGSDSFSFSLRFGPPGASAENLARDIYQKFADAFPPTLKWTDRRAIGALFLSTAATGWPTNPRGWLLDPKVDVTTASGMADLKNRILAYADASIAILQDMNAQGMITWDIEGQQYPHATSYIGDPRIFDSLAPEMSGIADEYFERFRNAGLRVGVCIRPQQLIIPSSGPVHQIPVADPTQLLIDKVLYATKRWNASLFYVDSNVNASDLNPIDAGVFQKLAAAFPDALFIPEHSKMLYYAYTAPYRELRQGHASTGADVRLVYPDSFSIVYTADGPIDQRYNDLVAGVKSGDALLFRGWFDDPQNLKDKRIYLQAGRVAPGH